MKPLEFLFYLLNRFIQFPDGRLAELKEQAFKWWNDQVAKDDKKAKIMKKSDAWYVQIGLAVALLFGVKAIGNWLYSNDNPPISEHEGYEEEEGYQAATSEELRKFRI